MANRSLSQQPLSFQKALIGSLSLRVFLISVAVLVIPLVFYAYFLYEIEYRQTRKDLFVFLHNMESLSVSLLEEQNSSLSTLLDLFAESPLEGSSFFTGIEQETREMKQEAGKESTEGEKRALSIDKELEETAEKLSLSFAFLLTLKEGKKWICTSSSKEKMLGKDYSSLMQEALLSSKRKKWVVAKQDPTFKKNYLYFGKPLSKNSLFSSESSLKGSLDEKTFLFFAVSGEKWIDKLAIEEKKTNYRVDLFLVDKKGEIFASSIEGKDKKLSLTPEKEVEKSYTLFFGNEKHLAVFSPIEGSSLSLVLTAPEKEVFSREQSSLFFRMAVLLISFLLIGGSVAFLLIRRMVRPLNTLLSTMDRVAKGDEKARFHRDKIGFEINLLGEHFNEMVTSLLTHQKEISKEKGERERLTEELKIGHEIQKSILSSALSETSSLACAFFYTPAKEVAGDFYDLFIGQDDQIIFLIADAAGKGIPACLYSLTLRSILRSSAAHFPHLKELVEEANALFCQDVGDSGAFITAWIGIYNPYTRLLSYTSKGHYPAFLKKRDKGVIELDTEGVPFGIEGHESVIKSVEMDPHDLLFLYTDGVIEVENEKGEFYGRKRLQEFFSKEGNQKGEEVLASLEKELKAFSEKGKAHDDQTALCLEIKGESK